jgi:hypothetical protein
VNLEVTSGSVDLGSAYYVDASSDHLDLKLTEGVLNLKDLKVFEKEEGAELISIPSLSVEGADIDLSRKNVVIDSLRSEQARVKGWLDKEGGFIYSRLWVTREEEEKTSGEETAVSVNSSVDTAPWVVTINELTLTEYGLDLENRATTPTLKIGLQSLGVTVKDLSTREDAEAQFSLSLRVNETGTVTAEGLACINPLSAKLGLETGRIALKPFQPLVNSVSSIDLVTGAVNLKGDVQYRRMGEAGPEIGWEGSLSILDFEAINRSYTEDFLKWKALEFNGILFNLAPNRLHLSEIVAKEAYARVIIWPDGSVNIKEAFSSQKEKEPEDVDTPTITAVEPKKETSSMPISVDTIRIEDGSANFADFQMKPNFFTGIHDLTGSIKGLSSDSSARADVSLSGKVDRYAPVKISGQINPLIPKTYMDMAMSFKNMELTPLTPYSGKFVGYTIEKGKLSLDLKYKLSENAIVGENVILLDQLTLGDRVESPDATSLPVGLAIALMRDTEGKIDIDLPVRGNLDDPEFSWGHLVIQALINLVTKAVTSPFALLGSLVGGDGEELSFVEFEFGSESLPPQQTQKLDKLAQALKERPALQLQIQGSADSEYDRLALAEERLMADLKLKRFEELQVSGEQTITKPEQIILTEEEFTRLLTEKYVETYGHDPFTTTEDKAPEKSDVSTEPLEESPGPPEIDPAVRMAMAKQRLIEQTTIDELALQRLAQGRATQIKGYLIEQGAISSDRLFAVEVGIDEEGVSDGETIRVNLTLTGS